MKHCLSMWEEVLWRYRKHMVKLWSISTTTFTEIVPPPQWLHHFSFPGVHFVIPCIPLFKYHIQIYIQRQTYEHLKCINHSFLQVFIILFLSFSYETPLCMWIHMERQTCKHLFIFFKFSFCCCFFRSPMNTSLRILCSKTNIRPLKCMLILQVLIFLSFLFTYQFAYRFTRTHLHALKKYLVFPQFTVGLWSVKKIVY